MQGLVKKSNLRLHTTLCVIPIPLQREKESQEDRPARLPKLSFGGQAGVA